MRAGSFLGRQKKWGVVASALSLAESHDRSKASRPARSAAGGKAGPQAAHSRPGNSGRARERPKPLPRVRSADAPPGSAGLRTAAAAPARRAGPARAKGSPSRAARATAAPARRAPAPAQPCRPRRSAALPLQPGHTRVPHPTRTLRSRERAGRSSLPEVSARAMPAVSRPFYPSLCQGMSLLVARLANKT